MVKRCEPKGARFGWAKEKRKNLNKVKQTHILV